MSYRDDRAQANLPVLAVALILLTTVTSVSIALADGALASADRDPIDRRVASAVAERLISADATVTMRANVLNETAIDTLDARMLDSVAPPARNTSIRVRLGDDVVAERGDPTEGVTVRRVVLVANQSTESRTLDLSSSTSVTLPRRTARVRLDSNPEGNTTVRTVRANDRVVLYDDDPGGVSGTATVRVSRYETTTLEFTTTGDEQGTVTVTYYPVETTKAVLEVTADA